LSLAFTRIGHEGIIALVQSPLLSQLVELDLQGNKLNTKSITILTDAGFKHEDQVWVKQNHQLSNNHI
jgi:hypothetical protein